MKTQPRNGYEKLRTDQQARIKLPYQFPLGQTRSGVRRRYCVPLTQRGSQDEPGRADTYVTIEFNGIELAAGITCPTSKDR